MSEERLTYKEFKAKQKEEQSKQSYKEIKEKLARRNEFMLELDNLVPQEHRWVDRGLVMSCEGGTHPSHRAFKR